MKCYTVEKTESNWGEDDAEIVGNAVYSSKTHAKKVAKKVFDDWLASNPHVGKNIGDEVSEDANGIYRAYTRGQSVSVRVEEHEFVQ